MDIFWGIGFIFVSIIYSFLSGFVFSLSSLIFICLLYLWGVRLALFIGFRNAGKPEDARYAKWRRENGTRWWWVSYLKVFLLQGLIMWFVSVVVLLGATGSISIGICMISGMVLFMIGFFFEAVGDEQMRRFKKDPINRGKVMDRGLWGLTRHPNYFGETVMWWAFFIMSLESGLWYGIISPLIMTFLLLRVSGVTMLDAILVTTKPGYEKYVRSVNAFFPGFRRNR